MDAVMEARLQYIIIEVFCWLYTVSHHIGRTEYFDVGLCKCLDYLCGKLCIGGVCDAVIRCLSLIHI